MTAAAEPATPQPFYLQGPPAHDPPPKLDFHEKSRIRAAAFRAKALYPRPVAELISRELLAWEDFGYVLGGQALLRDLCRHILTAPAPQPDDA